MSESKTEGGAVPNVVWESGSDVISHMRSVCDYWHDSFLLWAESHQSDAWLIGVPGNLLVEAFLTQSRRQHRRHLFGVFALELTLAWETLSRQKFIWAPTALIVGRTQDMTSVLQGIGCQLCCRSIALAMTRGDAVQYLLTSLQAQHFQVDWWVTVFHSDTGNTLRLGSRMHWMGSNFRAFSSISHARLHTFFWVWCSSYGADAWVTDLII